MTVHGAKGLEAPIVILADTTTPPPGRASAAAAAAAAANAAPGTPDRWSGPAPRPTTSAPMAAARAAALDEARDEYRRLLYVAMTRTTDRLMVCGVERRDQAAGRCWYELVRGALKEHASMEPADHGDGTVLALPQDAGRRGAAAKSRRHAGVGCGHSRLAQQDGRASRARRADQAVGLRRRSGRDRTARRAEARRRALQRGNIVHRLMQSLPDIPRGAPGRGRAAIHRAAADRLHRSRARRDRGAALSPCSPTRALPLCSRRAAAPRFRSSAASAKAPCTGVVDRLVVTADDDPDRGLQDQPPGAPQLRGDAERYRAM